MPKLWHMPESQRAKKGAIARLCAQIDGKEVWLTAFTDVMENLLAKVHLSINDTSDKCHERCCSLWLGNDSSVVSQ